MIIQFYGLSYFLKLREKFHPILVLLFLLGLMDFIIFSHEGLQTFPHKWPDLYTMLKAEILVSAFKAVFFKLINFNMLDFNSRNSPISMLTHLKVAKF